MALNRTGVRGLAFVLVFTSLPLFAIRKGDAASSQNGSFNNCNNSVREGGIVFRSQTSGQTKVRYFDMPLVCFLHQHHVSRLEIAMNNP